MGSSPASPKDRVLLVDDDEEIARLLVDCLTAEGYAVIINKDARAEAVQAAVATQQPDCILLDGGAGSGYGESWTTAALMARRTPPIPTIMFTAYVEAVAEAKANTSARSQAAGLTAVLSKPFDLSDLLSVVEEAVRRSREPDRR